MAELELGCRCGRVRGRLLDVSPSAGSHVACYCDDCQAYVKHLGAEEVLDAHGGTVIFQTTPSRMRIEHGAEHLACLRLRPKGLLRFYADCCNTPMGNAVAGIPFAGVLRCFICEDPAAIDAALGPLLHRCMCSFAQGQPPEPAHPRWPAGLLLRNAGKLLAAWLRGQGRPSPFFDASGRPVTLPQIIEPGQA
jgi:hypothetical protein